MGRESKERQIMKLLIVGDRVYLTDRGHIQEAMVKAVLEESILTSAGELFYSNHGRRWWLTRYGAETAMEKRGPKA